MLGEKGDASLLSVFAYTNPMPRLSRAVFAGIPHHITQRGNRREDVFFTDEDQFVVTLDYQQSINQRLAGDFPESGLAGEPDLAIHHEPGLWLYMKNLRTTDKDFSANEGVIDAVIEVARLATIPHGNSVLALGTTAVQKGMPEIPSVSGLPIGRFEDLATAGNDFEDDSYLEPYKHFIEEPFMGDLGTPGDPGFPPRFPGFNPRDMNEILRFANQNVEIYRTTTLTVDSTRQDAGVVNIPFVIRRIKHVFIN